MNQKKIQAQILEGAKTLVALHHGITQALKSRATDPAAWQTACDNFKNQYNHLAFPGGLTEGLAALKNHDASATCLAIEFLKADPYYYRSGYNKQKIAHLLKNVSLKQEQMIELQAILIALLKIKGPFYLEYCRLARKIQNPEFRAKVSAIVSQSTDTHEVARAKKMLLAINS